MGDIVAGGLLGEVLLENNKVTFEQLQEALSVQNENGRRIGEIVVELGYCTEEDVVGSLALQTGLSVIHLNDIEVDSEALALVPAEIAYRYQILPLSRSETTLCVATADPVNVEAEDTIRFITNLNVELSLAKASDIRSLVDQHYMRRAMEESEESDELEVIQESDEEIGDPSRLARESLVIRMVDMIVRNAVREKASDIHIEPFERELRVRYRVDGVLHDVPAPARRQHPAVISRLKIMANLDITERRRPQDGRIKIRLMGREIDLRVSVIPTVFGEGVVLRVLDRSSAVLGLPELGMLPDQLSPFEKILDAPHGIILATGPTGSGKTTTLYAALSKVYSIEKKVVTIEDPVEYLHDGFSQIQIRPQVGLTFSTGLRSILRHDPDIIMVGEIRDSETAEIAIHSALTGHLVFSTLHTNDSAGAVARLLEMGIEPFLIASSFEGVLAQRLVRKICSECKETYEPPVALRDWLVEEEFMDPEQKVLYRGRGCDECRNTGYSGRSGIFEILPMDDVIRELVLRRASAQQLKEVGRERGVRTLREDAWRKVVMGITTTDEVERVTQQEDDS